MSGLLYYRTTSTVSVVGSDLDGDEYSVIWDKELFFERNEPPMDFTKEKAPEEKLDNRLVCFSSDFFL